MNKQAKLEDVMIDNISVVDLFGHKDMVGELRDDLPDLAKEQDLIIKLDIGGTEVNMVGKFKLSYEEYKG